MFPVVVQKLPVVVRPVRNEDLWSYVTRLATVNAIGPSDLWGDSAPFKNGRRAGLLTRLSHMTGYDESTLARTLPDLAPEPSDHTVYQRHPVLACRRCAARAPGGRVRCLVAHHEPACLRHKQWRGDPNLDLRNAPAIINAQRRHTRAVRLHGFSEVFRAYDVAESFVARHARGGTYDEQRHELLKIFDPARVRHTLWFDEPLALAINYPRVVSITLFLLNERWRHLARSTQTREQFFAELGRRCLRWRPHRAPFCPGRSDPLRYWAEDEADRASHDRTDDLRRCGVEPVDLDSL